MLVCGLHCTVCNGTYQSISDWLRHLLSDGHQIKARKRSLRWGKRARKRTLIAFATSSMRNAEKLLQYFSLKKKEDADGEGIGDDGDMGTIVHDFVWWPGGNKEKMALLQFKNRDTVNKVMEQMGKRELQLPGCVVQFRKASTCVDLEWNHIIGFGNNTTTPTETEVIEIDDDDDEQDSECPPVPFPTPSRLKKKVPVKKEVVKQEAIVKREAATENESHAGTTTTSRIRIPTEHISQFQNLVNAVEIPDDEYKEYFEIIETVREFYGVHGYEVNMFKNFFLGLRNPGNNILFLHVYHPEQYSEGVNSKREPPKSLLRQRLGLKNETLVSKLHLRKIYKVSDVGKCKLEGMVYFNPVSKTTFGITHNRLTVIDVQLTRLIKYFCTFDSRVKSLLSLVYLWFLANNDNVRFGEEEAHKPNLLNSIVPEPSALDWIVILFLSQSHLKMIPTVNEILERPHPDSEVYINGLDIGFNADKEFVKEWKRSHPHPEEDSPEYIVSVLTLTKDFFSFLMKLLSKGKWVLNPRHGEVYSQEEFLEGKMDELLRNTKSSEDDTSLIAKDETKNSKNRDVIKPHRIYVMHPFNLTWKLACDDKIGEVRRFRVLGLYEDTVTRLELYLERFSDKDSLLAALLGDKSESIFKIHELKDYFADIEEDKPSQPKKRKGKNSKGNPAKKSSCLFQFKSNQITNQPRQ